MEIKNLIPVEWSNQRVLLTAQLAEFYECTAKQIAQNFNNNRERFLEGKHYFKLEGSALNTFKRHFEKIELPVSKFASSFYLWTCRGAFRHCKMIGTDKAWEVFEELEDCHFNRNSSVVTKTAEEKDDMARVYLLRLSDGTVLIVKIGHSKNIRARVAKIKRDTKLNVIDMYFTPFMSRENARLIEWACQEVFSSRRVKGEFFSVEFTEARKMIEYFTELAFSTLPTNFIADKNF